jgi:peptidoglycan/LPS O-acetylase OafA/YrhL
MNVRQTLGYQPALDGLRALSIIAVILYHADIQWIPGGFLGVEVFFVVSGYLITALLIEERESFGRISLKMFWVRRTRRLLPALFAMLAVTAFVVAFYAKDSAPDFRRDVFPAVGYVSNWWQIYFVDTPYFAASALPVLRHLWSLAVEEQWYLLWPLLFAGVVAHKRIHSKVSGAICAVGAVAIMVFTAARFVADDEMRANVLYLSTFTRSSGLLLGAAVAFLWRPWRSSAVRIPKLRRAGADLVALFAVGVLVFLSATQHVFDASLYRWALALTSFASACVVAVVVRPGNTFAKMLLSNKALVEVGRRSYGLYLWHWPIFVVAGARENGVRLAVAMTITVVVNEFSYAFIETPARKGAIGNWWGQRSQLTAMRRRLPIALGVVFASALVGTGVKVAGIEARDLSVDTANNEVVFVVPTTVPSISSLPGASTTTTTIAKLPRRVVIVGDSQAHSLAVNKPSGIEKTFIVTDGSIDGCGVYDRGVGTGGKNGTFRRNFANCVGFEKSWAKSATKAKAEVALVVLGAWEVLDLKINSFLFKVNTTPADTLFRTQVQRGVAALRQAGATVALLEVACMRPVDSSGGPVPALPERGDDTRTAHLNDLLREIAAPENDGVYFINGPREWCNNPKISTSLSYRWDGVHAYKPGAKLIFETVAQQLLQLPVKPRS